VASLPRSWGQMESFPSAHSTAEVFVKKEYRNFPQPREDTHQLWGRQRAAGPKSSPWVVTRTASNRSVAAPTVTGAVRATTGEADLAVGIVACLQTHGSHANWRLGAGSRDVLTDPGRLDCIGPDGCPLAARDRRGVPR